MARNDFEMVATTFGSDTDKEIVSYIDGQIEWLEQTHSKLHKSNIPKWRKLYLGIPAEETKSFPWPNAANTIVQVVGETVDTIVARVLGLQYATHPLFIFQNYAKRLDSDAAEDERRILEDFMDIVGYEPTELDLWPIESLWYTDAARLGTSFVKAAWEHRIEVSSVGYTESKGKLKGTESTIYRGPRVHNLRHEDVLITPDAPSVPDAEFVCHIRSLRRKALEERKFTGGYDGAAVDEILKSPDRERPRPEAAKEMSDAGLEVRGPYDATAEWDIYECYFKWWHNKRCYRIISSYHKRTKKMLRQVFNFLPSNETPIIRARLGYRTTGMYGHGFAELLERYQEELSTVHNQRLDNATIANTRMLRVSPRAITLDSNIEIYPSALLRGEKDDLESIAIGDVYESAFENEQVTLAHAQSRAGISPAISGEGSGSVSKKGGYSSAGTLAVMQESNSRVNLEVSDFRHAHVQLGSLLTALYGKFGTGGKEKMFGIDSDKLEAAFKEFNEHRLRLPIRAATASLNRELDKQSDMLLSGMMQRHYTAIAQLLQAVNSPLTPPAVGDYMNKVVRAMDRLMKRILKDFNYDQPDTFVPEPLPQAAGGAPQAAGGGAGGQMAPGGQPVGGPVQAPTASGAGLVPAPNRGGGAGGLVPTPQAVGGGTGTPGQ